ncbi:DUF6328 family protein [Modestobacter lapidis]|nr:hypothetical protein [Modestobacter lapidis]
MATDGKDVHRSARARGETPDEVLDRNVNELLQEMRVAITGVQVLFAFLLTLPFQSRFSELDTFGTTVYTVTLTSSALATMLLIAPVSFHRAVFRKRRKEALVDFAALTLSLGLALLLTGIGSAVLLVLDVALGRWPAVVGCALVTAVGLLSWYVAPLRERSRPGG